MTDVRKEKDKLSSYNRTNSLLHSYKSAFIGGFLGTKMNSEPE
jgi:hypothetical protein